MASEIRLRPVISGRMASDGRFVRKGRVREAKAQDRETDLDLGGTDRVVMVHEVMDHEVTGRVAILLRAAKDFAKGRDRVVREVLVRDRVVLAGLADLDRAASGRVGRKGLG